MLTPLYTPTIPDTICNRDVVINACTQRTTRTTTNSLPKPKQHYNDIHTIISFISINNTFFPDISPHSFEHTNCYKLYNFSFLSSPLPFFRRQSTNLSRPPNIYHEALLQPDKDVWLSAMQCKIDSLKQCQAFEHTFLPDGWKAIGVCWTFNYKYNPDGSIIIGKEKAHLVAQGFSQHPEDYGKTYAPVVKLTSVQLIIAFTNTFDYKIMSFDVKTAFLHARLPIQNKFLAILKKIQRPC